MSEELKPCPWCGRTASIDISTEQNTCMGVGDPGNWYASIRCLCSDYADDGHYVFSGDGETEEEAIAHAVKSWNRRPLEDALRAKFTGLKASYDNLAQENHHTHHVEIPHLQAELATARELVKRLGAL